MLENVSVIIPIAPDETQHESLLDDLKETDAEIIISSEGSRAKSLNVGAAKAQQKFLWFLHADSRVSAGNITALDSAIKTYPMALSYFDLKFDAPGMVQLNGIGANIRSRLFDLPYGDQGLCVSKDQFNAIGGYLEDIRYGEDVLFVRKAKKMGVKLNAVGSKLLTSARKYKETGWIKLTMLRHIQMWKLIGQRL